MVPGMRARLAPRLLAPRLLARPDVRIGSERRVWSATKPIEAALDGPFITAIGLLWRAAKRNVLQGKREKP